MVYYSLQVSEVNVHVVRVGYRLALRLDLNLRLTLRLSLSVTLTLVLRLRLVLSASFCNGFFFFDAVLIDFRPFFDYTNKFIFLLLVDKRLL